MQHVPRASSWELAMSGGWVVTFWPGAIGVAPEALDGSLGITQPRNTGHILHVEAMGSLSCI